jgi:chromosomal replication initiator protein
MNLRISDVMRGTLKASGVSRDDLIRDNRQLVVTRWRHCGIYAARVLTGKSLTQIGRAFNRDHTTVLHAVRKTSKGVSANHVATRLAVGRIALAAIEVARARAQKAGESAPC